MTRFILAGKLGDAPLRFDLGSGAHVAGRAKDCDILIDDNAVSRHHADVIVEGDKVWVHDRDSLNKTFVNGAVIEDKTLLAPGRKVRFGHVSLTLLEAGRGPTTSLGTRETAVVTVTTSYQQIRDHAKKSDRVLSAMAEAGQMLSRTMTLPELYENALDLVDRVITSRRVIILEADPETGGHRVLASRIHHSAPEEELRMSRSMVRDILQDGKAFLTSDAASDEQWKLTRSIKELDVHGAIGAPLFDNDRILGAIYLDSSTKDVIYRDEDLQLLTILANMVAVKVTNTKLEDEKQKLAHLRHELSLAADIQRNLLPAVFPEVESYQIFAHLDPCDEIGGDLYDVRACPDGRLWVVAGDVTGHGIGAALLMSHVMAGLRILEDECTDPSVMLDRLESFLEQQMTVGQYVTMFAGVLDPASGRLEYVNAGHPPVILLTKGAPLLLRNTGCGVAMLPGAPPRERAECTLEPESTLVVYSDGVSEIERDDEQYGERRMHAFLDQAHSLTAEGLVRGLLNDAMEFGNWEPVGDDLTLMAVKRIAR